MNERTEFDDLARRKLNEREFPFDPKGWEDMERQLDALPQKRNDRLWLLAALFLLITCGGVWYAIGTSRTSGSVQGTRTAQVAEEDRKKATTNTEEDRSTVAPTPPKEVTSAPASEPVQVMERTPDQPRPAPTFTTPPEKQPNTSAGTPSRPTPTSPTTKVSDPPATQHTDPPIPEAMTTTFDGPTGSDTLPRSTDAALNTVPAAAAAEPFLAEPTMDDPRPARTDDHAADADVAPATKADDMPVALDNTSATPSADASAAVVSRNDDGSTPDSTRAVIPEIPTTDSTTLANAANNTLPTPALHPHWEITAWGGLFNTSTRYGGARTADWATKTSARQTTGFGAELMHMGTHFGVGGGLHYSTYAEHLAAQELTDATSHLVFVHELQSIDTSIMVVNGTVWINGQQYYSTFLQDTTFLVLVTTTSQETVTTVRRNALARNNRTSYLEIPLLFDAHANAGRWGFGIRGGPMLAVLQGRRGVLPGTTGYTDLADAAFQDLLLGWTAQGYVRYRLAESWSIGVGPAARGQLLNSMQGDALVRRSTAWGGRFSISYQLR
jgi:hypothetical protein